jgi:hypothetical protein
VNWSAIEIGLRWLMSCRKILGAEWGRDGGQDAQPFCRRTDELVLFARGDENDGTRPDGHGYAVHGYGARSLEDYEYLLLARMPMRVGTRPSVDFAYA